MGYLPQRGELLEPVWRESQRAAAPQSAVLLAVLVQVEGAPPAVPPTEYEQHLSSVGWAHTAEAHWRDGIA